MNIAIQPPRPLVSCEQIDAVNQPIQQAAGMPNQVYTDWQCFEFERDHIFSRHWTAIGFVANFAPSSVKPMDFMGLPIVVSKDKSETIRVFHNVCSHRGMKLVEEEKQTNGLVVCPYHSWTYALNGDLKATPHVGGVGVHQVEGIECRNHGLREIRCHSWLGILFINLDGKAAEFEQDAAVVVERYKRLMGEDGESMLQAATADGTMEMSLECNWKLAVENYLEAYHLPFIHPSLNSYSPLSEHGNEIISPRCSGQISATFDPKLDQESPLPLFPGWERTRLSAGEYPALYPNLLLGFQANHIYGMVIHPVAPAQCREELMIFYVGEASTGQQHSHNRNANLAAWAGVFNEDIGPCERMQSGRQSPGYAGGVFSPVHDTCSHHFHKWVASHYAGEDGQSPGEHIEPAV